MRRKDDSKFNLLSLICILFCTMMTSTGSHIVRSDLFRLSSAQDILTAELSNLVISKVHCQNLCRTYSHCLTWAYDDDTGTCYLHPVAGNGTGDIRILANLAPVCKENEAPAAPGNALMTLHRSLTSLVCNVTCPDDFIYTSDPLPQVACLETGQWELTSGTLNGTCRQRIWRGARTGQLYPLPRASEIGWAMCFTGALTANSKFSVNLKNSDGRAVLHMQIQRTIAFVLTRALYMESLTTGFPLDIVTLAYPAIPFPFDVGEQFTMNITASGSNSFTIEVNGAFYAVYPFLTAKTTDVTQVDFEDDVKVDLLDLWCQ